jgi:hypothetical protein
MTINNALRNRANQADIVQSIINRLIDCVNGLSDQNCFLSDQPIPKALPGGRYGCTVSIGGGRFPHEFFGGGGVDTLTEEGSVIVTPIVITAVDRPYQKLRRILGTKTDHRVPGIVYFKTQILRALLASDWEPNIPTDQPSVEAPLLRDMLSLISADEPHDAMIGESEATAMQIRFATVFDWDLS